MIISEMTIVNPQCECVHTAAVYTETATQDCWGWGIKKVLQASLTPVGG